MKPRDYQEYAVNSIFDYFIKGGTGNPLVAMPTGCHAAGQGILMFDGTIKLVEQIEIGDKLMGPDSTARTVLQLCRGRQNMRRIVPTKGTAWEVNEDHILALYRCQQKTNSKFKSHKSGFLNQSIVEYEKTSKWNQHFHKLYRVGVDFQETCSLPLDPYFLGVFLGDGSYTQPGVNITSMDSEILEYCENIILSHGDLIRLSSNGSKASCLFATTKKRGRGPRTNTAYFLDALGLRGKDSFSKFIPSIYKTASRKNRLALLAGLIDTDGSCDGYGYEYCTVSKQLADDFLFIARSLGLAAYSKYKNKGSGYYRINLSGNLEEVPCLLPRKQVSKRTQKKNVLVTGFKIEKLPEAEYYGFTLTGDHLYLLDDFTVTHNTGKSVILAEFIRRAFEQYPYTRIMKLTHVKELIEQNWEKLLLIWPTAPAGVYSSGLGKKEAGFPITFGGVGTVARAKPESFGRVDLLLIDECHLVSPKESTQYQKVISMLKVAAPHLKVIGFTATPYRLGQGMLTDEGGLFTDVCCDMTTLDSFNWFIDEGYLAPLIPKRTLVTLDVSGVHISGGEFKADELQAAVDKSEITRAAVQEMIAHGEGRDHWLVFASGIEHTFNVAAMLQSFGISTTYVHSKMGDAERDANIADFVAGKYRVMVNNGILTTGFDFPGIDLIGILRPTQSPSLWVQMLGRGTRPFYIKGYNLGTREGRLESIANSAKQNCLVMDFADNTKRLGPINDPVLPRKKSKGASGTAPVKICEACNTYNHASARFCVSCGQEFPKLVKIRQYASTDELIASGQAEMPITEIFKVDRIIYNEHRKDGRPASIQASYFCGMRMFKDWICLEHGGLAAKKARDWWRKASGEPPASTLEALSRLDELKSPMFIKVWLKPKYDEILGVDYEGNGNFGDIK